MMEENSTINMTSTTPPEEQASRQFDIYRREATKLERLLEDKVARYQQVRYSFLSVCVGGAA